VPQYKVMVAQFPYSDRTHPDASDWVMRTVIEMREDPRIGPGNVGAWRKSDTPITMVRNECLVGAEKAGYDFVLMIDNDVNPDYLVGQDSSAKPFWKSTFDFALASPKPCIVAAPYVGPPPEENVFAFVFGNKQSDHPNPDFQIGGISRYQAARLAGIQPVCALATGLMLIDMRAVVGSPHPRFYYEYGDETQSLKASTEDVTFTRDAHYRGVPLYCNWDSWCQHFKLKGVGKPQNVPDGCVPDFMLKRAEQILEERRQASAENDAVATTATDSQAVAGVNRLPAFAKV